ncbi:MAG: ArdC-like ssDNA-binding domain-containing protein, partial [Runella zeae]
MILPVDDQFRRLQKIFLWEFLSMNKLSLDCHSRQLPLIGRPRVDAVKEVGAGKIVSKIELTQPDYSALTQQIGLALPTAMLAWEPAWHEPHPEDDILSPLRWNDQPYQGTNMLRLWAVATEQQYPYPHWMTHRQAICLGGQLKDQAPGVRTSYAQTRSAPMDSDYAVGLAFYRSYTVYNVADLAGLPARYYELPKTVEVSNSDARHDTLEAFFAATKVAIVRGNEAMYLAESDQI